MATGKHPTKGGRARLADPLVRVEIHQFFVEPEVGFWAADVYAVVDATVSVTLEPGKMKRRFQWDREGHHSRLGGWLVPGSLPARLARLPGQVCAGDRPIVRSARATRDAPGSM